MNRVLVTGAGGFIGSHLVRYLKRKGHWVRGVDIKEPRWSSSVADEFKLLDLRDFRNTFVAVSGMDQVYALAADMGGIGYIGSGDYDMEIAWNNTHININTLEAARLSGVQRYFFTSSACIYPLYLQKRADVAPLKESDAYPAEPDSVYGWEKLYTEVLCHLYQKDVGIEMRIARFHNIYGPETDWIGGRDKLPAAACRKVAMAKLTGNHKVEVWGDGLATRSFCYIDDCLEMLYRLMQGDYDQPMNIGTDRLISVNQVFDIVADIAGIKIEKVHVPGPQGVRGRNADLTLMREVLGYEPQVGLEDGLAKTYEWVERQCIPMSNH